MHPVSSAAAFYANPLLCETLEALFLWRLRRNAAIKRFPYLSAYVCYDIVRTPLLLVVAYFGHGAFRWTYWTTDIPAQLLHFFLLWEVARYLFSADSAVRRVAWNTLLAALTIMFPAIVLLCWGQASLITLPVISVASIFEQYSSLAQALLLLTIAAVARYYRIPFGRNMRGLVFSLGPYLLLDSMKFASYQVFGPIRVYVELLPAILFTGMLAAWVWAFWDIAPSPQQATFCQADADWKRQWTHVWKSTLSTLGRGPS